MKNKRLKYGSVAVVFTIVFIAVIMAANYVINAIAAHNMWYVDMTNEEIYTISESTIELLDEQLTDSDMNLDIIFCQPEDTIRSSYKSNMVLNCALKFKEKYDFINIKFYDIVRNPETVKQYLTTEVSEIKTYNVIISNGSQSQVYTTDGFFTTDTETGNVFAFDGEYTIASAILRMQGDNPIAYFVTGHGETTENSNIYNLFEEAGFDVKTIDLTKENISDDAMVVVINNPRYDYLGADDAINEISKIDKFLDRFGALMVFMDADERDLPELEEFLGEWGIKFEDALIRDFTSSLSVDGTEISAEYVTEGIGSQITKTLRSLETTPKAVVNYCRPISILYSENGSRDCSPVLTTSSANTAEAIYFDDEENGNSEKTTGKYNLMTISTDTTYKDNEPHYSYVLAAGTSSFTDDKYIKGTNYGNRDILFSAMKTFGKKTVPLDIQFKQLDEEALDILTSEANTWSVVIVVIPALIVSAVGVFVYIRRRRL